MRGAASESCLLPGALALAVALVVCRVALAPLVLDETRGSRRVAAGVVALHFAAGVVGALVLVNIARIAVYLLLGRGERERERDDEACHDERPARDASTHARRRPRLSRRHKLNLTAGCRLVLFCGFEAAVFTRVARTANADDESDRSSVVGWSREPTEPICRLSTAETSKVC